MCRTKRLKLPRRRKFAKFLKSFELKPQNLIKPARKKVRFLPQVVISEREGQITNNEGKERRQNRERPFAAERKSDQFSHCALGLKDEAD